MLTVQIDSIKEAELLLTGDVELSELSGFEDLLLNEQLSLMSAVSYQFKIFRISGMIEIQGHVAYRTKQSCSLCLEPLELSVESDFDLTYADQLPKVEDESGEEIELSAEDMGVALLDGEEINLEEPLVEQLILSMPVKPLCRKGCKGLCPHCGADLNVSQCRCTEPQIDTRFAALQNLKIDSDN